MQMGYTQLYLFTLDQQELYKRVGWRCMDKGAWMGISADVMTKSVAQQTHAASRDG
jgi:hypothetical protein